LSDNLYWKAFLSSLRIAAVATFFALLIGYPLAYAMSRAPRSWQPILLMAVILPFWTSYLIRIYAWKAILQKNGFLNNVLMELSVITEPLTLLSTPFAVYLGIIYTYLPFMVLPVYSSLEKIDPSYNEAARDLGASGLTAFWRVTVPLSLPGVIAGCFLVFIPAMGEWVIPDLLGGSGTLMIGKQLATELFNNNDWPVAAAVAVCMIMVLIVPIVIFQRAQESDQRRRQEEG
ncbi:MAG: ABC transporter permease, partial [Alphaproteobacteria bacterium]|nr:ABC transporter permease [Alphaproteobacteria bacterium]